jgi:hypothetical protein
MLDYENDLRLLDGAVGFSDAANGREWRDRLMENL